MRLLPLAVALLMAIPATVAVALPRAMPDLIEPLSVPLSGPEGEDATEEEAHDHGSESAPAAGKTATTTPASDAHHHERTRTAWPAAEGKIPTSTDGLVEVRNVLIEGEPDLDELEELGVGIAGRGTLDDPYVLEGLWVTRELEIKDTDQYYVVRGNVIGGTLRLNWNDDRVHVHHNDVRDLRVNENIERKGEATGGLIELNRFGVVGQIRHFDGVFRANEVGPIPSGEFDAIIEDTGEVVPFFAQRRTLNIDGFDGAIFEGNTIFGYVEMQLHGHHHASCFACHSHNHAVKGKMAHDHTIRYHEADFIGNTIVVEDGVAFRYTDAAHRGDDRTARSEPNKDLEKPHVHYTRIAIERNVIEGGPLVVDILNADSRDHENEETDEIEEVAVFPTHAYRADLSVRDNEIAWVVPDEPMRVRWLDDTITDGLFVRAVKEANVVLAGNLVALSGATDADALPRLPFLAGIVSDEGAAALAMREVRAASVLVEGNVFEGAHFGVLARGFREEASWTLGENAFDGVAKDVEHDASSAPEK